jgi:hypothetical protein
MAHVENGRACIALPDGTTEFVETEESRQHVFEALAWLERERGARRLTEPRYIGIRRIPVAGREWTVAEWTADFEVPDAA